MRDKKGITLIALIITIIVMLILVSVTISIAVNGGLFGYAGRAARETENEKNKELSWLNIRNNMSTDELIERYSNSGETLETTNPHTGTGTDVGDMYTIGTEKFYVIGSDETTVTLLAEKCLGRITIENEQNEVIDIVVQNDDNPYYEEYVSRNSVLELYQGTLTNWVGLTTNDVRFMSKDEANALQTDHPDILYGDPANMKYQLSDSELVDDGEAEIEYVWVVDGPNSEICKKNASLPYDEYLYRLVVVVLKSNL